MYFPYFQIFSTKVPPKFEKYMKLLDICGDTISKCPDIMRNNTPLLAHSLDSSSSIELKLLVNHYESPCIYLKVSNSDHIQLEENSSSYSVFIKNVWKAPSYYNG